MVMTTGRRAGRPAIGGDAGRAMLPSLPLPLDMLADVDALAGTRGATRAATVRELIARGLATTDDEGPAGDPAFLAGRLWSKIADLEQRLTGVREITNLYAGVVIRRPAEVLHLYSSEVGRWIERYADQEDGRRIIGEWVGAALALCQQMDPAALEALPPGDMNVRLRFMRGQEYERRARAA